MNNKRETTKYIIFFILFFALWIVLFWKCKFGFPLDESFYILFCYRFINGDIPVLHEWNPTQFFAIWIYPFVWAYYKIFKSSEQIILVFRYLFTFIWGISALFFFYRFRKISFWGAAAASLIFMVFVPYTEMALYYNTIGLISFTSALVIIITAEKKKNIQYAVSGFLFAVAVTCCPFLFSLYVILIFATIVSLIKKQKGLFHLFCCITAGAIPAIILVYWFYVMPSSLGEVLNGLQYLIADREHQFTYIDKFAGFFENIIYSSVVTILVVSIVLVALLVAIFKKTKKVKVICFLAVSISTIILEVSYIRNVVLSNEVLLSCFAFPPIFAGLYCGMLTKDKLSKRLFYNMYIPGLMYMFCINISSNVGFEASVIPSVICTMASCFIVSAFMKENAVSHENILLNRLGLSAFSFSVLLSLCAGIYVMSFLAFANGRIDKLNSKIERGPYKGIYCTQSVHNTYNKVVMDMEPIKNSNSEKVLLLAGYWYYLDVEKKPSSCSCLCPYIDDALLDQLEEYYSLYPQFIPDIIYLDYRNKDLLDRVKAYGYREEETALGSYILYRELEK